MGRTRLTAAIAGTGRRRSVSLDDDGAFHPRHLVRVAVVQVVAGLLERVLEGGPLLADRLAAETARSVFRLPYYHASIRRRRQGDRTEVVARRRVDAETRLTVTFESTGELRTAAPDTLASFLVERERYFTTGPLGTRLVGSVGHPSWSIQTATATITENTLLSAAGIDRVEGDPLVHYSPGVEMGIGALQPF